jgi:hypothetical protein
VHKVTKTKGGFHQQYDTFETDEHISKKWIKPLHNWVLTAQQWGVLYEGRFNLELEAPTTKSKNKWLSDPVNGI